MVPLLITMAYNSYNTVTTAFVSAENELKVTTELIEKEVNSLLSSNFTALRLMAVNPSVQEYLAASPENRNPNMKSFVQRSNALFADASNIVLTDNTGQQAVRSDDAKLVNLQARDYFKEAMKGNENISEVVVSKTTGLAIVVIEVPVKSPDGQVIGMIQRNYNISALTDILKNAAEPDTELAIFESNGKLVAHSEIKIEKEEDRLDMSRYDFISKAQAGERKIFEVEVDGEKKLVSCEREPQTNWIIATLRPYSVVESEAIHEALVMGGMCLVILVLILLVANFIANAAVAPILTINHAADEISKGNLSLKNVPVNSNDELGNVAKAFATMTDKLNDFFRKASLNATTVSQSAEALNENSRQSAEAANQIATSVSEFANATVGQQNAIGAA
ncbi:MAG: HAMP domain-containing protein, partial [Selenomonadaceae bacterium]|nr:HAMP domain-containing protein [Selenomonadaceae bacterium]